MNTTPTVVFGVTRDQVVIGESYFLVFCLTFFFFLIYVYYLIISSASLLLGKKLFASCLSRLLKCEWHVEQPSKSPFLFRLAHKALKKKMTELVLVPFFLVLF